jgi:hypothetical protein
MCKHCFVTLEGFICETLLWQSWFYYTIIKDLRYHFIKVGNNATSLPLYEFFSSNFVQLNESINLILWLQGVALSSYCNC